MQTNLIITGYVLVLVVGILLLLPLFKKKEKKEQKKPNITYKKLMNILANTIERELSRKFQVEYSVKEIKWIDNYEEELKQIAQNVMGAFSPYFMEEMQYYHNRDYIYKMVVQSIQAFMINYIKENKLRK